MHPATTALAQVKSDSSDHPTEGRIDQHLTEKAMSDALAKPRLVGINHVALEVGDLDEALTFYGAVFEFRLRGKAPGMAFIDMGDQFLALSEGRSQAPDTDRHF